MARASHYLAHRQTIIDLIAHSVASHSRPPTVRALAIQCGVAVATMHSYLQRLSEEGLVEWQAKSHRSLKLTPKGTRLAS
jgi:predicted transcriptional regulator